ncbi:MAG: protein translocase subunit SecD, partial [Thermodesulfobacteriota bacterium]
MRASRGWIITILVLILLSVLLLIPTVAGDTLPKWWGKVFPDKGINLGLDLRGGIFLLLGVDSDKAVGHELNSINDFMEQELKNDKVLIKSSVISGQDLTLQFFSKEDLDKAKKMADDNFRDRANNDEEGLSVKFALKNRYLDDVRVRAIDQVKQVLENRIQEMGLVEPSVQKAGADRILIQVPGASERDRQRVIDIIKRSAVLQFKIVADTGPSKDTLLAKYGVSSPDELVAKGLMLVPGDTGNENEKFFVVSADSPVTGESLSDARLIFDEFGRPAVGFSFKGSGASKFGELTEKNVGKRLAIDLDGTIKSAPTIQERITSQGRITGNFTTDEAKDLALVLRSGSLPVPVSIEQENTVGPSLGKDSIDSGKLSMIVGGALVVVFMMIFYKLQGLVADIALALNMLFIMGFLSAFGVTLTLPGIAGLVLTMGMAVDGNIIIFERIKEELRAGKSPYAAIEAGYQRSFPTVFDSNTTTLITGLILFWFGTGPIKGFAATLSIG